MKLTKSLIKKLINERLALQEAEAIGLQTYAGDRSGEGASVMSKMPKGGQEVTKADLAGGSGDGVELVDAVAAYLKKLPNAKLAEIVTELVMDPDGKFGEPDPKLEPYLEDVYNKLNALPEKT